MAWRLPVAGLAVIVTALLTLSPGGGASHLDETPTCPVNTWTEYPAQDDRGPAWLVVDELVSDDYITVTWVYVEANGLYGLQRWDEFCGASHTDPENHDFILLGTMWKSGESPQVYSEALA